jgi:transposase
MRERGLDLVNFPTYSPDLKPIGNFWVSLKREERSENPKIEKRSLASLKKNWKKITEAQKLKEFFRNLYSKFQTFIELKGEPLTY